MKSVMNIKRFSQREMMMLMGGMTALAFLLLLVRIRTEGNFRYLFLVWNLFLAYVPLGVMFFYKDVKKSRWLKAVMLSFWLLFFPNAPYILTDYIHLRHYFTVLDFLLVSSYALIGLLVGFYSLRILQQDAVILQRKWSVSILFFITSVGVYLGRFIRWNSWDILDHPLEIVGDVFGLFLHPMENLFAMKFIVAFTLFLTLTYAGFNFLLKRIHEEKEV